MVANVKGMIVVEGDKLTIQAEICSLLHSLIEKEVLTEQEIVEVATIAVLPVEAVKEMSATIKAETEDDEKHDFPNFPF